MQKSGKLELTWVGKYEQKGIEPRILVEDKSKSYGDPDSENMLIHGDNLIALKALEQDYAGRIKCIYIDPPFNTGSRIDAQGKEVGYDDGLEHSIWLQMMRDRLVIMHNLLTDDGAMIVHLDDRECAYCKILLDEIFGRENYINMITMTTNDPSGFKATGTKIFSTSNFMLIYGKDKSKTIINKIYIERSYDFAYSMCFTEFGEDYTKWRWRPIKEIVSEEHKYSNAKEAIKVVGKKTFDNWVEEFALKNYNKIFRTAAIGGGAKIKRQETIDKSKNNKDIIMVHPNEDVDNFYILNGEQILFYKDRFRKINGKYVPTQNITDVWTDIAWTGIASEGGVVFKNSKKPELLIYRVLTIFSNGNDIILDSFLGSGTTAAVAHKMGRRWIGIELGEHAYTHCKVRMDKVIDGEQGGISKSVNWQGGGGYKFYELAPSLLVPNPKLPTIKQINPEYTFDMMCEAICKLEGFKYKPDGKFHGKSSEQRFIHITKEFVNGEYINSLLANLGEGQSLLVYGTKIQSGLRLPDNVVVKKIPKDLLDKCTFESEVK